VSANEMQLITARLIFVALASVLLPRRSVTEANGLTPLQKLWYFRCLLVGAPRFELGTPSPPDWCANRAALRSERPRTIVIGGEGRNRSPSVAPGIRVCESGHRLPRTALRRRGATIIEARMTIGSRILRCVLAAGRSRATGRRSGCRFGVRLSLGGRLDSRNCRAAADRAHQRIGDRVHRRRRMVHGG
jgi:hypothetical protein